MIFQIEYLIIQHSEFLQDFEVWDDVGLNIPKPPELLYLYRESMKNSHILDTMYQDASIQTDGDTEEIELLVSQYLMYVSLVNLLHDHKL